MTLVVGMADEKQIEDSTVRKALTELDPC